MEAILKFNLPEDKEQFDVAAKAMDWALLVWDIDQSIRSLMKYHPEEYKTGEQAFEHIKEEMYMPTSEEEFQADLAADDMRYHHYCLEQQEMYDDPYLNWSGLR